MNSRQRHEYYSQKIPNYKYSAEEIVQNLINQLIDALYVPVEGYDRITKVDKNRLELFKIDSSEPINWGDLKCNEVKKLEDGTFLATVDEDAPDDCPTLCDYIERFMHSYGWEVKVKTEW